MPLFNPKKSVVAAAKPFPVLLLLDTSASMDAVVHITNMRVVGQTFQDGRVWDLVDGDEVITRINELNKAVRDMTEEFKELGASGTSVSLGVVTFNSKVEQIRLDGQHTFAPADHAKWTDLTTEGETCLGAALTKAKELLEDKNETPGHAYRPLVVLISDGEPTDSWQKPLDSFIHEGRSAKCDRLALMVGEKDGGIPAALRQFAEGSGNLPAFASEVGQIDRFFKYVTMSVSARSKSTKPNDTPQARVSVSAWVSQEAPSSSPDASFGEDIDPFA